MHIQIDIILDKRKESKNMFKDLLKVISLTTLFILAGNLNALCQKVTSSMPDYMMLLTIICMLVVLWYNVIKLYHLFDVSLQFVTIFYKSSII